MPNENSATEQPSYAAAFRCIGPDCEDPCCSDWDIPLDRNTFKLYQQFPLQKLGSTVSQYVFRNAPDEPDELYGKLYRAPNGSCPFYGQDHLCGVQKEYGHTFLSATCSIYPRSLSLVAGTLEGSLSLSCPEAARNVLLNPDFAKVQADLHSGDFRTDNVFQLASDNAPLSGKPPEAFLSVREKILSIIRDRRSPISHRLLQVGALCHRLTNPDAPEPLINSLPTNPNLRLQVIFTLSELLARDTESIRFREVFWNFVAGISASDQSAPSDDLARFLQAEQTIYQTFLSAHAHIPENYLLNYVYQHLFPYGRKGSTDFTSGIPFNEYLKLAVQFTWLNGLLIGLAAHHQAAFSTEHIVEAVQSFTRAVEHYPETLRQMEAIIRENNLNTLEGTAILLRS